MSLMKINCVILNYNDADTTKKLVGRIRGYESLNQIVVVDNASTDDSAARLKELEDDKVVVLVSDSNRGYGAGNNMGVEYSFQIGGATHVIIANPDTSFTENCIEGMSRVFYHAPDVGVVAATMEDAVYGSQRNGWPLRNFTRELLSMGPVSRRLFRRLLEYPESYFQDKNAVYVDAVHGSMLMVDGAVFTDCGGYDENVFLYQEESVLGWKMKQAGYRTVLLLNCRYLHEHSVSIRKTYQSQLARQQLRHDSTMYYFRQYLHINRLQEEIARIWFRILLLEIRLAAVLLPQNHKNK